MNGHRNDALTALSHPVAEPVRHPVWCDRDWCNADRFPAHGVHSTAPIPLNVAPVDGVMYALTLWTWATGPESVVPNIGLHKRAEGATWAKERHTDIEADSLLDVVLAAVSMTDCPPTAAAGDAPKRRPNRPGPDTVRQLIASMPACPDWCVTDHAHESRIFPDLYVHAGQPTVVHAGDDQVSVNRNRTDKPGVAGAVGIDLSSDTSSLTADMARTVAGHLIYAAQLVDEQASR